VPRDPSTSLRSARDDRGVRDRASGSAEERTPAEILKKIRALEIKTKGLVQSAFAGDYTASSKDAG